MDQETPNVFKHPEWKVLYDAIMPFIEAGMTRFSYGDLSDMLMLDVRQARGRGQFYKFRKEILKDHQIWFECKSDFGYCIIEPKDHPKAAVRRIDTARRKVTMARAINTNVQYEHLSPDERVVQAATAAVLHNLAKQFRTTGKRLQEASKATVENIPIDLQELLKSVKPPKRIKEA